MAQQITDADQSCCCFTIDCKQCTERSVSGTSGGVAPQRGGVAPQLLGGVAPQRGGVAPQLGGSAPGASCYCFMSGCKQCFGENEQIVHSDNIFTPKTIRLVDSGKPPTAEMAAVISLVDCRLADILNPSSTTPNYLQHGPDFIDLRSWTNSDGSRHDHLVAFLCGCGVRTVHEVRRKAAHAQAEGRAFMTGPAARGRHKTKQNTVGHPDIMNSSEELLDDVTTMCDKDMEGEAEGPTYCEGVKGEYLPHLSKKSPRAHATALVLGRLFVWGTTNDIPQQAITALLAQLVMAGVDIGQKHHDHTAMITYRRILVNLLHSDTRQYFWDDIPNLQHPSGWRLIFDSITLANGSTEMVMIVVYTTRQGELRKQLFDLKKLWKGLFWATRSSVDFARAVREIGHSGTSGALHEHACLAIG